MSDEATQLTQEDPGNPDNPGELVDVDQFRTSLREILENNELSAQDRKVIRGMVELITFASDCVYIQTLIEENPKEELHFEIAGFSAVKVDGRVHFDPPTDNATSKNTPILEDIDAVIKLFESDLRANYRELNYSHQSEICSDNPVAQYLEQMYHFFWSTETNQESKKLRSTQNEERVMQLKQTIHIHMNAIKHSQLLQQSLNNGFHPIKFQELVLKVNAYLLNHFVEKYRVE